MLLDWIIKDEIGYSINEEGCFVVYVKSYPKNFCIVFYPEEERFKINGQPLNSELNIYDYKNYYRICNYSAGRFWIRINVAKKDPAYFLHLIRKDAALGEKPFWSIKLLGFKLWISSITGKPHYVYNAEDKVYEKNEDILKYFKLIPA